MPARDTQVINHIMLTKTDNIIGNPKTSANNSNLLSNTNIYFIPYISDNLNNFSDALYTALAEVLTEE